MKSVRNPHGTRGFRAPFARRLPRALALFAAALALPLTSAPGAAQQLRELRLTLDNDAYNFWIPFSIRPDEEYTNGIELTAELAGAPGWGRFLSPGAPACTGAEDASADCLASTLHFGQKIFTPRSDAPTPGERPYAGWLYAASTGHLQSAARRRSLGVEVGVTGPPSLAQDAHRKWHELFGFWAPTGWERQVKFEPGVVLRYDEARLLADVRAGGVRVLTLAPEAGAALGNVLTGAHGAVRATAGYAVPHPWSAAADRGAGPVSVYVLGGVRGRAVAHTLFLDGNTFRGDGPAAAERRPLVGEAEAGAGVRLGAFTFEYRAVTVGREYESAPGGHTYSTLDLRLRVR